LRQSQTVDKLVEADLAALFESSVVVETIPFELVDRSELICLQQSDLCLSSLFELAEKGDDHYFLKSGVLLRSSRDKMAPPESSFQQFLPLCVLSCFGLHMRFQLQVIWE